MQLNNLYSISGTWEIKGHEIPSNFKMTCIFDEK